MSSIIIAPEELKIVKQILCNVSNVVVFGSRIKGTGKPFSDLDLCIKDNLSSVEIELLREKFENSDLPFRVDIVEYHRVNDFFKKMIDEQGIELRLL